MALTIGQIQNNITNGGDVRQIINQIADYIEANPGGGGGSDDSISVAVVDLTDAQIKLADTAIEIIPSPGANKMINFIWGHIITKFTGGVYGNLPDDSSANLAFTFGDNDGDASSALQQPVNFGLFYGATTRRVWYFPQPSDAGVAFLLNSRTSTVDHNLSLFLATVNAHGDLTGGHANNTMRVIVGYTIQDIP